MFNSNNSNYHISLNLMYSYLLLYIVKNYYNFNSKCLDSVYAKLIDG